jgi:hypothetical protein
MREINTYDAWAKMFYELQRNNKRWPPFYNLKRKERDYWRGLGQIAKEQNLWPAKKVPKLGEYSYD